MKPLYNKQTAKPNDLATIHSSKLDWFSLEKTALSQTQNTSYYVNFQVQRKLNSGESLCVLGSLPSLGQWKQPLYKLEWNEGDIWKSKNPLITTSFFFTYKYAIFRNNYTELIGWERGVDRISDLEIMPDTRYSQHGLTNSVRDDFYEIQNYLKTKKLKGESQQKHCTYYDIWEMFEVSFTIQMPIDEPHQEITLNGNKTQTRNVIMQKMPREYEWMNVKYGKMMCPYQCSIKFENTQGEIGQFKSTEDSTVCYSYSKTNNYKNQVFYEREPQRRLQLQDPSKYVGQLGQFGNCLWLNTDKVWIVNGVMHKADGNFLNKFFFKKIDNSSITLGSYPLYDNDIQRLQDSGVNAVLNIQDHNDLNQRDVRLEQINQMYRSRGINNVVHSPVSDYFENEYCEQLFKASLVLNDLVNIKKLNVFCHCSAGISRGPTLFLCYLALFMKHPQWNNINELYQYLKHFYPFANPNLKVVKRVLEENKDFIDKQKALWDEEQRRRQKEIDDANRKKKLMELKEEYERLVRLRQSEADSEKDRVQRAIYDYNEKQRQQKENDEAEDRYRKKKLQEEIDRIERDKLADQDFLNQLRKQFQDEQQRREADLLKYRQEIEILEEKIRLQNIALQSLRDQWRVKKEKDDYDEIERQRKIKQQWEETLRIRKEQEELISTERSQRRTLIEQDIEELLERIRVLQIEGEKLREEIIVIEEESCYRQKYKAEEEEQEREKQKREAEMEAQQLLQRLKIIEEEEAERLRKKKMAEYEFQIQSEKLRKLAMEENEDIFNSRLSHIYLNTRYSMQNLNYNEEDNQSFGNLEKLGITEAELEQQCEELFKETPITFQPRQSHEVDEQIFQQIQNSQITFPIVWVRDSLYLIGTSRINVELKNSQLVLRVGGGYEKFEEYIVKNNRQIQKQLVIEMIKSGESLEWVIDQLINGNRIKNVNLQSETQDIKYRRSNSFSKLSPLGSSMMRRSYDRLSDNRMSSWARAPERFQSTYSYKSAFQRTLQNALQRN